MKLEKYIDNTLLKPNGTKMEIQKFARESLDYNFAALCILPGHIEYIRDILINSDIKIATVVGFPLGLNTIETKVFETKDAIKNGGQEIDMVINISWAQDKKYHLIKEEINEIFYTIRNSDKGALLKVIIETCYLDKNRIIEICKICKDIGVDFVKTSTGFGTGGAKIEDVILMKEVLDDFPKIKDRKSVV